MDDWKKEIIEKRMKSGKKLQICSWYLEYFKQLLREVDLNTWFAREERVPRINCTRVPSRLKELWNSSILQSREILFNLLSLSWKVPCAHGSTWLLYLLKFRIDLIFFFLQSFPSIQILLKSYYLSIFPNSDLNRSPKKKPILNNFHNSLFVYNSIRINFSTFIQRTTFTSNFILYSPISICKSDIPHLCRDRILCRRCGPTCGGCNCGIPAGMGSCTCDYRFRKGTSA